MCGMYGCVDTVAILRLCRAENKFKFCRTNDHVSKASYANPQLVLVAAQTQFSQGTTEGVYCSDNGGASWTNILPGQLGRFVRFASFTVAYAALGNPFGSPPKAPKGNGIYKPPRIGSTYSTVP